MNLYHITVANKNNNYLDKLKKSTKINNIKTIVLGIDKPNIKIGFGKGFGWKLILLREYIDNLNNDDIFIFTDAYDVIFSCGPNEILSKFNDYGTYILFSSEKYCYPDSNLENKYLKKTLNRPNYLNSGTFMAHVGYFKKFYDENKNIIDEKTDDQRYYTTLYLKHQRNEKLIKLDKECKIFMCLSGSLDLITFNQQKKRYYNKNTCQYPCILHANGNGKKIIFKMYKNLYSPKLELFSVNYNEFYILIILYLCFILAITLFIILI